MKCAHCKFFKLSYSSHFDDTNTFGNCTFELPTWINPGSIDESKSVNGCPTFGDSCDLGQKR